MGTVGELDKDARYILRVHVGEATLEDKGKEHTFVLATLPNQSPLVTCKETGYHFMLSWPDVIQLAIKAGITAKEETES